TTTMRPAAASPRFGCRPALWEPVLTPRWYCGRPRSALAARIFTVLGWIKAGPYLSAAVCSCATAANMLRRDSEPPPPPCAPAPSPTIRLLQDCPPHLFSLPFPLDRVH